MNIQFKEFKINKYLFYSIIIFIFLAGFIIQFYVIKNRKQNSSADLPQLPQVQDAAISQNTSNTQKHSTTNTENNISKGGVQNTIDSKLNNSNSQPMPTNTVLFQSEDYSYSFSQSQSQSVKVYSESGRGINFSTSLEINISQRQSQSN